MANSIGKISARDSGTKPQKTLSGYLAASLDLEEHISNGVYRDYLHLKNWPPNLNPKNFEKIKNLLIILIKDTENHKKIIRQIQKAL